MRMTQLCYLSKYQESELTLIDDIREILIKSRKDNQINNICGLLYYKNRRFFQCLEGDYALVMNLIEKIKNDSRHTELKVISCISIENPIFSSWSMKYIDKNTELDIFLDTKGYDYFHNNIVPHDDILELLRLALKTPESNMFSQQKVKYNKGYVHFF